VLDVTLEIERVPLARNNVVLRTPEEIREDRRRAALRQDAALKVALVTLIWLVSVSLLFGWGITGPEKQAGTVSLAALLAVVLPFVAAVIATRNQLYFTGGVYVVLTLAMVLPALSMVRAGA
jgi:formate hydrogenlyase subunit 4